MTNLLSTLFAGFAVLISLGTWLQQHLYRKAAEKRANVTVRFHWLTVQATVTPPGREPLRAGYHLVLTNRGPATAREVDLEVKDAAGNTLTLLDLQDGELPLPVLDAGAEYPIPWLYEPFTRHQRRFSATVRWTDDAEGGSRYVPLRRGQTNV
jgi:hypothetical protein